MDYYPLKTGPVTLGIRFDDKRNLPLLSRYFKGYRGTGDADALLGFTVIGHDDDPDIPTSLIQAKRWENGRFEIGDGLIAGSFDEESDSWEMRMKAIMIQGRITRVFEQFLYQAFYSACRQKGENAFLLHSAGVCAEGNGFLFVGASGKGKSTVAALSRRHDVINDEMNILSLGGDGMLMHPSPFNAYFKRKSARAAHVRAIFLLEHAKECRIEPVSPAIAIAEITGQLVPPLGIEDSYAPAIASTMMGMAIEIVKSVPVYTLFFPVEGGFWPLILDKFR